MKTRCAGCWILSVLSSGLLLAQETAPPKPSPGNASPAPATAVPKLRAGATLAGEVGVPVVLKGLEDIPTVLEGSVPANLRSDRILPPEAGRQLRLERSRVGGVLGEALLVEHPLDLLNPLAPASAGDGTRHLSSNPFTGRAEGLILFSLRLPERSGAKSLARRHTRQAPAKAAQANSAQPPTGKARAPRKPRL